MTTSNRLVTLATFPAPATAGFIKSLLIAEGVQAFLADEITMGMFWHLGNSIGWVKVQVAEADVSRANEILEACRETLADLGLEAFVMEAMTSIPSEESSETVPVISAADEPDYAFVDPTDELAVKALRSAVVGMIYVPLALYGAWLVVQLMNSRSELSATAARKLWLASGITFAVLTGYSLVLGPYGFLFWVACLGALSIRAVLRWVNRRDDPRHAARPVS
jgi:hypothetical protein